MTVGLLDLLSQGCRRGSQVGCGPNVDRHRHYRGLLLKQKLTAVIRMLAYGSSADQVDKIARMGKSNTLESLVRFCDAIEILYTRDYFCKPTPWDL
ncbi:unnamed protein product [Prunus armeniaca]